MPGLSDSNIYKASSELQNKAHLRPRRCARLFVLHETWLRAHRATLLFTCQHERVCASLQESPHDSAQENSRQF